MSLRPTVSTFRFTTLQALFGCGDREVVERVNKRIRAAYQDNMPLRVRAREYVEMIVMKGRDAQYPDREDETLQIVVNELAHEGQEHERSDSLFWESLLGALDAGTIPIDDNYLRGQLSGLIRGTPLFGRHNGSTWAYYGLVWNDAARLLAERIPQVPALRDAYDAETARAWLAEVTAAGKDLWCWVS